MLFPLQPTVHRIQWQPVAVGAAGGLLFLLGALRSPWLGLSLLVGLAGFLLVMSYPAIGMGVLTFLIPLERLQRFTSDNASFTISVMRLLAIACLCGLIIHRVLQRRSFRLDLSMFLFAGYVVLALSGLFRSSDPAGTKRAVGTILANALFFFLYFNFFENRGQIRNALLIWLAANLLGAAYSTYDWHFGSGSSGGVQTEIDPGEGAQTAQNRWSTVWQDRAEWETLGGLSVRRSMGPTSHAAVYGINLIMTIPFLFLLLKRYSRPLQQAGLYLCLGLIGYNVLLTNTRAVILMAAGTVALCFLFGLVKLRSGHILLGLVAIIGVIPMVPKDIYNRVLDPHNYSSSRSAAMRVRFGYWKAGLAILQEHPFIGVGVGNTKEVPAHTRELAPGETTVHNIFLQVALESGLVGWTLFFGFVALAFHAVRQAARRLQHEPEWQEEHQMLIAVQVLMLSVLIFGLQVDVFEFPLKGWWLFAVIGFTLSRWARALKRDDSAHTTWEACRA